MSELNLAHHQVEEILDELDGEVSEELETKAYELAKRASLEHTINRRPSSMAAASVYFASLLVNQKRTQGEVMEASGVGEYGLRESLYDIGEAEGYDMNRGSRGPKEDTEKELLSRVRQLVADALFRGSHG